MNKYSKGRIIILNSKSKDWRPKAESEGRMEE